MRDDSPACELCLLSEAQIDECLDLWSRTPGVGLSSADDRPSLARFLEHNPGLCWCGRSGARLVGTILCGSDGRRGYLYHLAVETHYRRSGLGRELVDRALTSLRASGITKCHAMVFARNADGRGFWNRVGWRFRDDLVLFSREL